MADTFALKANASASRFKSWCWYILYKNVQFIVYSWHLTINRIVNISARDETVDMQASKACASRRAGSNPAGRTPVSIAYLVKHWFCKPKCEVQVLMEAH